MDDASSRLLLLLSWLLLSLETAVSATTFSFEMPDSTPTTPGGFCNNNSFAATLRLLWPLQMLLVVLLLPLLLLLLFW